MTYTYQEYKELVVAMKRYYYVPGHQTDLSFFIPLIYFVDGVERMLQDYPNALASCYLLSSDIQYPIIHPSLLMTYRYGLLYYWLYLVPFEDVPLHIFATCQMERIISQWRLQCGK